MENKLNHWHADQRGSWIKDSVGLGQLMLWNTPESLNEKLPFYDSLKGLAITADARIDNRNDLFDKLSIDYPYRKEIPDSVIILNAYAKYGEDCVKHLIGDFAFAIWNEKTQKLFCARDHMGVKPFFYYKDEHFFVFASEKKGILCLEGIDASIDKSFLYNQIVFPPYQEVDTTLYKKIRRLPPAQTVVVDVNNNAFQLKNYWKLDTFSEISFCRQEEYYEGLLYHFEEAIKCRIRSVYKVGAELSGGMDSSVITGAAQAFLKEYNKEIISFSNTVSDPNASQSNERKYTDEVIAFNCIKDFVYLTDTFWNNPSEESDFFLEMNDGPERMELLWQLPIKRIARQRNIRTMLSGFAGDEMVTNRAKNFPLEFLYKRQFLKYFSSPGRLDKLYYLLPAYLHNGWVDFKIKLGLFDKKVKVASRFYNIPYLYKKQLTQLRNYKVDNTSYREVQAKTLLSPDVYQRLECESRHGIYFKLESRFPMADIRLTQFYLSMPNKLKYEGPMSRMAYRNAVRKYLPPLLFERDNKLGANAPYLQEWRKRRRNEIVKLLQNLPDTPIIKRNGVALKINQLNKEDKIIPKGEEFLEINVPNLHILRWLEKKDILFKDFY